MERPRVPLTEWLGCPDFEDKNAATKLFSYIERVSKEELSAEGQSAEEQFAEDVADLDPRLTDPTSPSFVLWESAEDRRDRREVDRKWAKWAKDMSESGLPSAAREGQIQSHEGRWMHPSCWQWLSWDGNDEDISAKLDATEKGRTMLTMTRRSQNSDIEVRRRFEVRKYGTDREPKAKGDMYLWEPCTEADVSELVPSWAKKGGKWVLKDCYTFEADPSYFRYWCYYIPREYKYVGWRDNQKAEADNTNSTETSAGNSLTLPLR